MKLLRVLNVEIFLCIDAIKPSRSCRNENGGQPSARYETVVYKQTAMTEQLSLLNQENSADRHEDDVFNMRAPLKKFVAIATIPGRLKYHSEQHR